MVISPPEPTSTGDDGGVKRAFLTLEGVVAALVVLGCMGSAAMLARLLGRDLPVAVGLALGLVGLFGGYAVGRALVRRYYRIGAAR